MQSTHFVPDEVVGQHGLRAPADLSAHSDFAADALGERRRLMEGVGTLSVHQALLYQLRGRQWVACLWSLEAVWLLFVAVASGAELWGDCPLELGLPRCRYCHSGRLLAWNGGLVFLWTLHLYLSVLLVAQGFKLQPRPVSLHDHLSKGISKEALQLFLVLSGLMMVWFAAGAVLLVLSQQCAAAGRAGGGGSEAYEHPYGRSRTLWWATLASVALGPLVQCLGRFHI
mmetsp:Transcript_11760/g.31070  ORF Transcript_11760/g.31070 Transcript_11760/m.31070 type:complete len:228 (-) Transcript_11760:45-728(-)